VPDKSKENYKKSWRSYDEPFEDEPCRKKEKMWQLAVNTVEAVEGVVKPESSEVAVTQLQKVLASCMKEMAEMRKVFGTVKGPSAQPNTTAQRGNRPSFNQAAGGPPSNNNFRPRVPNAQAAGGYRGARPRQQNYAPRGSTQCFRCRQWGTLLPLSKQSGYGFSNDSDSTTNVEWCVKWSNEWCGEW